MKNIILFGAPGVGKGTQASLLAEKFDLIHLSTGEMLRHEVAKGTPLGLRVKDIMNRGDLVGDDIVVGLIAKALDHGRNELLDEWDQLRLRRACGLGPDDSLPEKPQPSIIYDGFPRTVQQCQMLEFLFQKKQRKLDAVISIDVPQEELVRRIHERAMVSNRSDDTPSTAIHADSIVVATHNTKGRPKPLDALFCLEQWGNPISYFSTPQHGQPTPPLCRSTK